VAVVNFVFMEASFVRVALAVTVLMAMGFIVLIAMAMLCGRVGVIAIQGLFTVTMMCMTMVAVCMTMTAMTVAAAMCETSTGESQ